jgi:hypothetical protein
MYEYKCVLALYMAKAKMSDTVKANVNIDVK